MALVREILSISLYILVLGSEFRVHQLFGMPHFENESEWTSPQRRESKLAHLL